MKLYVLVYNYDYEHTTIGIYDSPMKAYHESKKWWEEEYGKSWVDFSCEEFELGKFYPCTGGNHISTWSSDSFSKPLVSIFDVESEAQKKLKIEQEMIEDEKHNALLKKWKKELLEA